MLDMIRKDFPMLSNNSELIYFDSGATSLKPQCVIDEIVQYYTHYTSNVGRGDYDISVHVTSQFEKARACVAQFIDANSASEIIFTSGATDSLNMAAKGYFENIISAEDVLLTTCQEHSSSILPVFELARITGAKIKYVPLKDGRVNLDEYSKLFENNNIKGVFVAHISNVLGYINPIKEMAKIAHDNGALISVDGAQSTPHYKVSVQDMDVDFFSFSGHKMLGSSGIGVLYGKKHLLEEMTPTRQGGGANSRFYENGEFIYKTVPHKFEAGTAPIEQVLALRKAIEYLDSIGFEQIHKHEKELSDYLIEGLKKMDNVIIYNEDTDTGIVVFSFEGIFPQDVATYFSKHNICVRGGNHCAKLTNHIIGTTDTLRASLYIYNTLDEVKKFLEVCQDVTLENCIDVVF